MMQTTSESGRLLINSVLGFVRMLHLNGFDTGTGCALDVLRLAQLGQLFDRSTAVLALRPLLCFGKLDFDRFDELFDAYFDGSQVLTRDKAQKQKSKDLKALMFSGNQLVTQAEEESCDQSGATDAELLLKKDFASLPVELLYDLELLADRLLRRLVSRLSRRYLAARRGRLLDIRATLRRSLVFGGDPFVRRFRKRPIRKPSLLFFLDCSGSMDQYSLFFLRFIHLLSQRSARLDAFCFSTRLIHLSPLLKRFRPSVLMAQLCQDSLGWSGGTQIGASLAAYLKDPGRMQLGHCCHVFILSDGLDVGDPSCLSAAMAQLARRCKKIVWLNPLLRFQAYQPLARGMMAALPHIDLFLPAHNLESLLALEALL